MLQEKMYNISVQLCAYHVFPYRVSSGTSFLVTARALSAAEDILMIRSLGPANIIIYSYILHYCHPLSYNRARHLKMH